MSCTCTVFVAIKEVDVEPSVFIGAFSTNDKAMSACEEHFEEELVWNIMTKHTVADYGGGAYIIYKVEVT